MILIFNTAWVAIGFVLILLTLETVDNLLIVALATFVGLLFIAPILITTIETGIEIMFPEGEGFLYNWFTIYNSLGAMFLGPLYTWLLNEGMGKDAIFGEQDMKFYARLCSGIIVILFVFAIILMMFTSFEFKRTKAE